MFPINSLAPGATTVGCDVHRCAQFEGSSLTNFAEVGSALIFWGTMTWTLRPVTVAWGADEDDYDDATITVLQQQFDLRLAKELKTSATPYSFPGSTVTYRVTITNEGDLEALNIQLRDYIPLGLVLADNNWSDTQRQYGGTQHRHPAPGTASSFDITFTVSPDLPVRFYSNYAEIGAATNSMGTAG